MMSLASRLAVYLPLCPFLHPAVMARHGLLDATRTPCYSMMRKTDVLFANMGIHFTNMASLMKEARIILG